MDNTQLDKRLIEDEAINWIAKLSSGTITELEEHAFFNWLEASPAHQAAYIKAEQIMQTGSLAVKASAHSNKQNSVYASWFTLPVLASTFACLLFITLAAYIFVPNTHYDQHHLITQIGEQRTIQLSDGSTISINTNSELSVEYKKRRRLVKLKRGEAFFNVTKDRTRPFEIITPHGAVQVLGTQFSINTAKGDDIVTVVEGTVALGEPTAKDKPFITTSQLTGNQSLSMKASQRGEPPKTVDAKSAVAWQKKQLVFRNQPLADVIQELNRYTEYQLVLANNTMASQSITAVIQLTNQPLTGELIGLALNLEVQKSPQDKKIHLSVKK